MKHCIQTVDFSEFLDGLEVACHAEYNGSQLYKYIELLVTNFTSLSLGKEQNIFSAELVSILTKITSCCDLKTSLLTLTVPMLLLFVLRGKISA